MPQREGEGGAQPKLLHSSHLEQKMGDTSSSGFGALFRHYPIDMEDLQQHFHAVFMDDFQRQLEAESSPEYRKTTTFGFLDATPFVTAAVQCIVQDSFSMCFECMPREHWNWNIYLFPLYCIGVVVRYGILFPLRILLLVCGTIAFFIQIAMTHMLSQKNQTYYQQRALQLFAFCWVASWSGVIRYNGACPPRRPNQIYVANHTTVLDIVVILNDRIVSLVGQRHTGVLGFFQTYVLDCMSNLWFDRMDQNDRSAMAHNIKEHIQDASKPPLLLFPEGTCVNNEYAVMFKRGAFDLDATIIPVAIKYNRLFGDAFWNSKLHSFPIYLARLMTSWCVVADVTYLEPQVRRPGESSIDFASRVKHMICDTAGLQPVPWDGYLKYFKPSEREKRARQKIFSQTIKHRFGLHQPQDA